ncbi:MAG: hypothetical protein VKO01_06370 [Cyanobacteriota bacterium]|nr:hypothetical protein [Cyanobacteriota bacterium]
MRLPRKQPQGLQLLSGTLWLVLLSLGLLGCRAGQPPDRVAVTTTPAPSPEAISQNPTVSPSPAPGPQAADPQTTPATPAPKAADQRATLQLPAALMTDWQPLSKVLLSFGTMTLTPTEVKWGSGQTSPYTVLNQEGGFLLQLAANPKFYDTPSAYLKLIPKTNEAGAITGVDVAFYETEAQVQTDEYAMYGSYSQ